MLEENVVSAQAPPIVYRRGIQAPSGSGFDPSYGTSNTVARPSATMEEQLINY